MGYGTEINAAGNIYSKFSKVHYALSDTECSSVTGGKNKRT